MGFGIYFLLGGNLFLLINKKSYLVQKIKIKNSSPPFGGLPTLLAELV